MSAISKIFSSLKGHWKFSRRISDQGTVEGIACFRKKANHPNLLFYREEGVFTCLKGQRFDISQEYKYLFTGERIDVFFSRERDRLLHSLEFTGPHQASALHLCGNDTYSAAYQFQFPSKFELQYIVKGPKKDYQIQTLFLKTHNPGKY